MKRQLNGKLLLCLLGAVALLGVGVHTLHGVQVKRSAGGLLAQAEQAEAQGDLARAADYLERFLAFRPNDVDALVKLGGILEAQAQDDAQRTRAIQTYEKALRANPLLPDVRRRVVDLKLAQAAPDYSGIRAHLELLAGPDVVGGRGTTPEHGELEYLLGRCHEGLGAYDEAIRYYEAARTHAPDQIDAHVRLAELLRARHNDPGEADAVIDALIATNGHSARAHLARARYRTRSGLEGAAEDLARALELDPDDPEVLQATAVAALDRGDLEEARKFFERGVALRPKDVATYQGLAEVELKAGRPEEALRWLDRGIAALPDEMLLPLTRASILIQNGRPEEAEDQIAKLKEAGLRPEIGMHLDALVRVARGQWAEAARLLDRASPDLAAQPGTRPTAKQALILLAQCYERTGELDRRHDALRRAVALDFDSDPYWVPARLGLAASFLDRGELDKAIREYRLILPKAPAVGLDVARLLIYRNLSLPPQQRRWSEVEGLLDEAARLAPDSLDAPILHAEALVAQDQPDRARDLLEQVREAHRDRVEPWVALAGLAGRQGPPEAALSILEEAQEQLGDRPELRLARVDYLAGQGGDRARQELARLEQQADTLPAADQEALWRALARAYHRIGAPEAAARLWEQLLGRHPDDLGLLAARIDLALLSGDEAAARQAIDRTRVLEGPDGTVWRHGEALLLLHRSRGMPAEQRRPLLEQASRHLNLVVGRRPDWSRPLLALAEVEALRGDTAAVVRHCRRAVEELGDRSPQALIEAARLLYGQRQYTEADRMLAELRNQGVPISGDLRKLAADVAFLSQDLDRALELASGTISDQSEDLRELLWLGRLRWAAGQDAEPVLRRAIAQAGAPPEVWAMLIAYLASRDRDKAEAALQDATRALPADVAYLALAAGHEALGRPDQAEAQYQGALEARPGDLAALKGLAAFHLRRGRPDEAATDLQRIIEDHQGTPEADAARRTLALLTAAGGARQADRALAILERGDADRPAGTLPDPDDLRTRARVLALQPSLARRRDAISALEQVIAQTVPTAEDLFLLARLHEATGNWEESRRRMRELLEDHGQNPTYRASYITSLLRRKEIAEAQTNLARLEQVAPNRPITLEARARVLVARDQQEEATRQIREFAQGDPGRLAPAALLLEQLGQQAAAEELYRAHADRFRSGRPEAVLPLAGFLGRRGRIGEALALLDDSLWQSLPTQAATASVVILYGAGASDAGLHERVARRLEEAIRQHPDQVSIQFDLANLRILQGDYDNAETIFRAVHDRNGTTAAPLNNLAWLLALRGGDRLDEASELIEKAIAIEGESPDLLDTRALVHLAAGRTDAAIRDLEDAIAVKPLADMYFHLAHAYARTGRLDDARKALQEAEQRGLQADGLHPIERPTHGELTRILGPSHQSR